MVPLLEGHGHQVIAPDLPGHGADATPLSAKPYENYVPKICALLDDLGDRAILVGHSSGGMKRAVDRVNRASFAALGFPALKQETGQDRSWPGFVLCCDVLTYCGCSSLVRCRAALIDLVHHHALGGCAHVNRLCDLRRQGDGSRKRNHLWTMRNCSANPIARFQGGSFRKRHLNEALRAVFVA